MPAVYRPAQEEDLDAIMELAKKAGSGLTNLPNDRNLIEAKLQNSVNSFKVEPTKPRDESYFFILEVEEDGKKKIVGTSEIFAKVGGYEPFYSYKITRVRRESKHLNVCKEFDTLQLVLEHNGPSEVGSLFLDPNYRKGGNGKLLSLGRFLFIGNHRERFENTVIAEMRGGIDENGKSPFWEKVVKYFFDLDFDKADYLSVKDKGFIGDLMPKHPIYVPLLPEEVKKVIGEVHHETAPALKLLLDQGFEYTDHIDIFDAGPRIACATDEIKAIQNSKESKINMLLNDGSKELTESYLIAKPGLDFKAALGKLKEDSEELVSVSEELAKSLDLKVGDAILYSKI